MREILSLGWLDINIITTVKPSGDAGTATDYLG